VAVVLAAGKGTRMRSELPKVLHRAAGRPLVAWAVDAARAAGCDAIVVVVGHGAGEVRDEIAAPDVDLVLQAEQLGTGHAVAQAAPLVAGEATVLVLSGDVPLVRPETLTALAEAAEADGTWGALAVADVAEPGALGRVLRTAGGAFERIVEAADAAPDELAVTTINAGLYALPAPDVFRRLDRLVRERPANAQGEIYLTDVPGMARAEGETIAVHVLADPAEAIGVNTPADLAAADRALRARLDMDAPAVESSVQAGGGSRDIQGRTTE
jgi:bifunctional UDP-N-acetylglucosamine pyrophosphorylase/glucosamine-1-phosphate N-acetyltransferase